MVRIYFSNDVHKSHLQIIFFSFLCWGIVCIGGMNAIESGNSNQKNPATSSNSGEW